MSPTRMKPQRHLSVDVYTLALERAAEILDRFDHVAVAFSGGKDSTATLQVMLEAAHANPRFDRHLPLRAFFQDEEAIPFETEEYVRRVAQRGDVALEWYCIPLKHRNACSRKHPYWWPWAPEAVDRWCRPIPAEAITELAGFPNDPPEARLTAPDTNGLLFPPHLGNSAMVMGVRAQESLTRRRAVTRVGVGGDTNYLNKFDLGTAKGNLWKAYPIYDWTTDDVWTAPALKGWDYNRAYDRLEMAGLGRATQRCSPAFGEEPLQKLHTYATCFPDVWQKMVDRVPGVGAAVRYALTELYSYRGRPEKPVGMPWPDFIVHYFQQFRPAEAQFIARRVGEEIRSHYRKTRLPIMPTAPCPVTGLSWDFLLMIAMRGDFKGRKQTGGRLLTDAAGQTLPKFWHRYTKELAEVLAAGTFADLAHPEPPPASPYALIPPEYRQETDS